MTIRIEPAIFNFMGYGNLKAPYWFIGLEEGFDKSRPALEEQHKVRLTYSKVMDLEEAMVKAEKWRNLEEKLANLSTQTWSFMTKIIMNFENQPWNDLPDKRERLKKFMLKNLGRTNGLMFLTEILPLPKSKYDNWPPLYEKYYPDVETYREAVIEDRKKKLYKLLDENSPKFVFAYGKGKWNHYKSLFPDIKFKEYPNSNGTRKYVIGSTGETTIVLTYFLGNSQFLDEDTFHLVKLLKS